MGGASGLHAYAPRTARACRVHCKGAGAEALNSSSGLEETIGQLHEAADEH